MKFLEVIKNIFANKNNQSNTRDYESIRFIMDFLQCPCEVIKGGTYTSESLMKRMTEELEKVAKAREAGEDYSLPLLIIPSSYLVESLESFLEEHKVSLADSLIAVRKEVARIQSLENEARAFLAQDLIEIWGEEERAFVQELESDLQSPATNNQSKGLQELIIFREDEHQDLILAQIPAREPYELACYVPMGDFNECPAPSLQAAIFKEWSKRFYPAVVSYCEWQCMILPSKKEDFISDEQTLSQLAREHLIFNPDILQSCENLQEYKTMLKYSSVWYFWWD
ncbi:DUF4253 domain-containing protein [Helicobacter sp. MIT 05-5293]|uniref:DUF4253 domain-containing protein n=1 Tax=Helicobacter sp. MIT 05-5293 TaxID=1548149 RepID=UPI00051CD848|nr:DUF4253 domain-containing protein [Helicobacter sp. MIT 05-5293]TLD82043.1 DUF4253 domain-containing protein [Helicobacter sp. MIT 05-5293]